MIRPIPFTKIGTPNYEDMSRMLQFEDLDIIGREFDEANETIIFYCEPRFKIGVCPECGELCHKIHDESRERRVRDAPIRGCNVLLIFKSTRLKCGRCRHQFTLPIRDVVPNCTYTYRLAEEIANPKRKQDIATLARIYGIGYKTVEGILKKAAEAKLEERKNDPIRVIRLGIDEISNKKGHGGYVLVLTDLDRRILLDILPDRSKKRLIKWLRNPPQGIILKGSLKTAACDLWSHYKDAVLEVFPNVYVVADRFHVMTNINETINEERRKAQSEAKTKEEKKNLKGLRYILLKNKSKLSEKEIKRLEKLKKSHPKLYRLWELRQELHEFYEKRISPRSGKKLLNKWIRKAKKLNLVFLDKFCRTLQNWKKEILNFFTSRTTSGFVEGMNSKIRLFKRIAFGMPNFDHFRLRMLWACG